MSEEITITYPHFTAAPVDKIEYAPGCWNGLKISVYKHLDADSKVLLGTYDRNYSSFFNTFCPFKLKGKQLALYSPHYTVTRIMEIHDDGFVDIGGEEKCSEGFCPTDLYVPIIEDYAFEEHMSATDWDNKEWLKKYPDGTTYTLSYGKGKRCIYDENNRILRNEKGSPLYEEGEGDFATAKILVAQTFGFSAGCYWGDDSSWKIQFLDLSKADEGKMTRTERFGYIELHGAMTLKDSVSVDYLYESGRVQIAIDAMFDFKTGSMLQPIMIEDVNLYQSVQWKKEFAEFLKNQKEQLTKIAG